MKKVLIVDDQDDIREVIRITLDLEDFEIYEAPDGVTGLAMAVLLQPAIMLLDLMMPGGLDGLQLCQRVKSDPALQHMKVVILTARGLASDRQAAMRAGADQYLTKPFSPIELLDMVNQLLR